MKKTNKLNLESLKVKSFITNGQKSTARGGIGPFPIRSYTCVTQPDCENTVSCNTFGCGGCTNNIILCIG